MRLTTSDGVVAIFTFRSDGSVTMQFEGEDTLYVFSNSEDFYFGYLPTALQDLTTAGLTYKVEG